ncbi:MAG TPA: hypothetical protein VFY84_17585 [Jiangellales bacterium]|nr:hypothetical protein [Jiangellales bacterium]
MTEPTPYQPQGRRASRRRTVLIALAAVVVVVAGLALHVAGILPPE